MLEWLRPPTVEAALAALAADGAVALGGGTSTALLMKQGMLAPSRVVTLRQIGELRGLRATADGGLAIGAATTLTELADGVRASHPALAACCDGIGNVRIRNVATVGGALAHADPAQDLPPMLMVLDARVVLRGAGGERTLPLARFFSGFMETALQPGELITRVEIPATEGRAAYLKFTPRSQDDYATVGVACRVTGAGAVLGLAGVAATPLRLEVGLEPDQAAAAAVAASDPFDDLRGSAAYKRAMTAVWVRRVLAGLLP
jgi:carbon-monoxide dehydrogenase medium subunit